MIEMMILSLLALVLLGGEEETSVAGGGQKIVDAVSQAISAKITAKDCWHWIFKVYQMAGYVGTYPSLKGVKILFKGQQYDSSSPYLYLPFERYNELQAGDWIYVHNANRWDRNGNHSDIFLSWADFATGLANNASSPGANLPGHYKQRNLKQSRIAWWMRPA